MIASQPSQAQPTKWLVGSVRFTMFLAPGSPSHQVSWNSLTGSNAAIANAQGGISSESGPFSGVQLTLQRQPNRIDVVFLPAPTMGVGLLSSLGPFPNAANSCFSSVLGWLAKFSDVTRIAVGLQLFEPSKSIAEANSRLLALIPKLHLDLANATDFLLQLNLPKPSAVRSGMTINRIFKLQVNQTLEFILTQNGIQPSPPAISAALELDISTSIDNTADLSGAGFDKLAGELTTTAIQIGTAGPPI